MNSILIIGIVILILICILITINYLTLKNRNTSLENENSKLVNNYEKQQKILNFYKRENNRNNEQIKIYEEESQKDKTTEIYSRKIKIEPIYKNKRALVGDYCEDSSQYTMRVLKSLGFVVDTVRTGEDIVDKIKHGYKCDIIITVNVYNKGYDGETALSKLKKIDGFNTPVIIHSVSKDLEDYFIYHCGFNAYIEKPMEREEIKVILEKIFNSC